ncbi:transposase [Candidatus Glomeribacter gigasporarum]|uniref:transposase n=1 Tax=Candidatus Glomeribacter gigasporarum TaxID=132144 RepID=UPI00193A9765|nr:transposase [Candidatus Glomeribacter gigasporarum]
MNLQLHHVVTDITGETGMKIMRAIIEGERDPQVLAKLRDCRCKASEQTVQSALVGNYQPEHVFSLKQTLSLYDVYQARIQECDAQIEQTLALLAAESSDPNSPLPKFRCRHRASNSVNFDVRPMLYQITGTDLTQIHGIGPYLVLRLVSECGSRWPSAKHFTSWLCLSPSCKISGGKVLSARTQRTSNRATAHLRRAAVAVGRTHTALGAFYRRLAARIGKAKAVTATARKIAILFYNAMRYGLGYQDPGADYYEQRYRERVIKQLHRRAAEFGLTLQATAGTS